jgi:hypothetical protein
MSCGGKVTTKTVGPSGGTVNNSAGVTIQLPAGAVASSTNVTIQAAPSPAAVADSTTVGTTYLFGPEGATFAQPVTVTIPFSVSDLPQGYTSADIEIFTAPEGSSDFTSLGGALADSTHIQATTTHFSQFVPGVKHRHDGGTPAPDGGGAQPDGGGTTPDAGSSDGGSANDAGSPGDGGSTCGVCNGCCLSDGGCGLGNDLYNCGMGGAACVDCLSLTPAKQCFPAQPYGGYCQ